MVRLYTEQPRTGYSALGAKMDPNDRLVGSLSIVILTSITYLLHLPSLDRFMLIYKKVKP